MTDLAQSFHDGYALAKKEAQQDAPLMSRRVAELEGEIERLTTLQVATAARAELSQIEIERLRADNEWLRGIMRNAIAAQDFDIARAALAPKP